MLPKTIIQRSLLVLLLVAVSQHAGPITQSATADANRARPSAEFTLNGTNGYRIIVRGSQSSVVLIASHDQSAAVYVTQQGKVTAGGLTADFGKLGDISVRFRESTMRASSLRCNQTSQGVIQNGVFVGAITFHGEHRFTMVDAPRARGKISVGQDSRCRHSLIRLEGADVGISQDNRKNRPSLEVIAGLGQKATTSFYAGRNALADVRGFEQSGVPLALDSLDKQGVPFSALTIEERGWMQIARLVAVKGSMNSFVVDPSYANAQVAPPRPFSGTASFAACKDRDWAGSLSVSFPGRPNVSLAGGGQGFLGWVAKLKPHADCNAMVYGSTGTRIDFEFPSSNG